LTFVDVSGTVIYMSQSTTEENEMKRVAYHTLNKRYRVLAPHHEARVIWRDFDPYHAVQAIATVEWPALNLNTFHNVVLTHTIMEGDKAI
jgi:hypothetical protein